MVRRRLFACGICATFASGILSFLAIVALDWLLWLPMALRMLVGALFTVGFIAASIHWIVKPLWARLDLDQIASRLERYFPQFQDRLSSTVNFLQRGDAGSQSMMRQVIANTDQIVRQIPLESALSLKPVVTRGAALAAGVVVLSVILLAAPSWARTGAYRYLYPLGAIEWPRNVSIVPLTGTEVVALGESVTVRMRIERGWHERLRAVVRLRESDGQRFLPIWIGAPEATAIAFALEGVEPQRPLTHDLLKLVTEALGATLSRVVVTELRDGIYFADLVFDTGGGEVRVSARPSDSIALAARTVSPIFVFPSVLDEAGVEIRDEETEEEEIERFRDFLDSITPEDFDSAT